MLKKSFLVLLTYLVVLSPAQAFAEAVGRIVSIDRSAFVERDGAEIQLTLGSTLLNGDIVVTNKSGKALITFADGTDIAVGANSRLDIDEIVMQSNGIAQRFSVNALGGTFRFLSGNSPKGNYEIKTPTATMGIRGTVFDFFVSAAGTEFVLLKGAVLFCNNDGGCTDIVDRCGAATIGNAGEIGIPEGLSDRNDLIIAHFPFIRSQENLPGSHSTYTRSCGSVAGQPVVERANVPKQDPVVPEPPAVPEPPVVAEPPVVPEPPVVAERNGNCGGGKGSGGGVGDGGGIGSGINCGEGNSEKGNNGKGNNR